MPERSTASDLYKLFEKRLDRIESLLADSYITRREFEGTIKRIEEDIRGSANIAEQAMRVLGHRLDQFEENQRSYFNRLLFALLTLVTAIGGALSYWVSRL
jgi:hypothetical protein